MATESHFGMFDGDGRMTVKPTVEIPGTRPITVTRARARNLIERFMESGTAVHSSAGGTLWVLIQWCQFKKISYMLVANPGKGYVMKIVPPLA